MKIFISAKTENKITRSSIAKKYDLHIILVELIFEQYW